MFFAAFENYFDFSGRATRREFWSFVLIHWAGLIFGFMLLMSGLGGLGATFDEAEQAIGDSVTFLFGLIVLVAWVLITIIPSISVTVRRFHDQNISGWWYLGFTVMSAIPYVNILSGIAWLILMLMPGTPTGNRYGENPRENSWSGGETNYA